MLEFFKVKNFVFSFAKYFFLLENALRQLLFTTLKVLRNNDLMLRTFNSTFRVLLGKISLQAQIYHFLRTKICCKLPDPWFERWLQYFHLDFEVIAFVCAMTGFQEKKVMEVILISGIPVVIPGVIAVIMINYPAH